MDGRFLSDDDARTTGRSTGVVRNVAMAEHPTVTQVGFVRSEHHPRWRHHQSGGGERYRFGQLHVPLILVHAEQNRPTGDGGRSRFPSY